MTVVSKEIEIDMGHTVTLHDSKCKHLHGHRYRIVAVVAGEIILDGASSGMVVDFSDLKAAMMKVIDEPYDHAFVVWKEDPRVHLLQTAHDIWNNDYGKFHVVPFIPTAENLAKFWFKKLREYLKEELSFALELKELQVYETPTSCASYTEEEYIVVEPNAGRLGGITREGK